MHSLIPSSFSLCLQIQSWEERSISRSTDVSIAALWYWPLYFHSSKGYKNSYISCISFPCCFLWHCNNENRNRIHAFMHSYNDCTYVDIQSSRGFVSGRVTDQHGLQAIFELQTSVNPLVLWRANYITHLPLQRQVSHCGWRGWQQPAMDRSKHTILQ